MCGLFEFKSLRDKFFVSFIDYHTRYIQLYLIEKKSEVFTIFKIFKLLFEKQSGYIIKKLKTNYEDESVSI